MAAKFSAGRVIDLMIGWQDTSPGTRSRLLQGLCANVRLQSLITNSLTLIILSGLIIAESRNPVHVGWVVAVILGGLLPRVYARALRQRGDFGRATDLKALGFLLVSGLYGLIWGLGPFLFLPDLHGSATGIFLFIMVFGTVMGPYAALPGILYVRLATTGIPTLVAVALYTGPQVLLACLIISLWLVARTDVWRSYHRTLRRQLELQAVLERRHAELKSANQNSEEANRQLRKLAETDPLTGAYNRRELMRRLGELSGSTALILFDVDHFKQVNDTFGHHAGDEALVRLVGLVHETLRKQDLLARTGGEEFVLVLAEADRTSALAIAERVRRKIEAMAIEAGGRQLRLTVSLGVALLTDPSTQTVAQKLREADAALYQAKRRGRNRVEIV